MARSARSKLDMSLADIITLGRKRSRKDKAGTPSSSSSKKARSRRDGSDGGGARSSKRKTKGLVIQRSKATPIADKKKSKRGRKSAAASSSGSRCRSEETMKMPVSVQVSNLEHGVTENDLSDLFSDGGGRSVSVRMNHDSAGRSNGTAVAEFARAADAIRAFKMYHGVPLDGRQMKFRFLVDKIPKDLQTSKSAETKKDSKRKAETPKVLRTLKRMRDKLADKFSRGGDCGSSRKRRRTDSGSGDGSRSGSRRLRLDADELDRDLDEYMNIGKD